MKLSFSNIINGLVLIFSVLATTSCESDTPEIYIPQKEIIAEFELASTSNMCKQVFKFNPWLTEEIAIPLNAVAIRGIETENDRIEYSVRQGEKHEFLVLKLKDKSDMTPFVIKVYLPKPGSTRAETSEESEDTVYLICQDEERMKNVVLPHPYLDQIGKGVNIVNGELLATPRFDLLSIKALWADKKVQESHNPVGNGTEISDASYSEATSEVARNVGVSSTSNWTKIFWEGSMFSGSLSKGWSKSTKSAEEFEYHIDIYKKTFVAYYLGGKFTEENSGPDLYTPYMSEDAYDLLNNPESSLYQAYPNTYEGISKLLDKYGTHVTTGGVFGGTFTAYYRRKATSYYTSTSLDFSLSLSCKKKGQGEAKNWMESYLQAQAMQGGTLEYGKESSNSDLQETSEEEYKFEVRGGNESGDFDSWSASIADENSNLALVSYSPVENMCCLIPLWYLAADEARRNALKENLDKYIKENADTTNNRLVVADFMMVRGENGHKEPATDRQFEGADGVVRNYVPLVLNKNFHDSDEWGKMVETSSNNFLSVADNTDQLWYVALDYENSCIPIEDIAFLQKKQSDKFGYTPRGDSSQEGMNYPEIDEKWVCLKFAGPNSDRNNYITAVGLCHKWNGDYKVITSSQGTEWKYPFNDNTNFKKYFNEDYEAGGNSNMNWEMGWYPEEEKQHYSAWFGNVGATHGKDYIFPCFSRQTLDREMATKEYAKAKDW